MLEFPSTICESLRPSVNFPCISWTFRQLQSTFLVFSRLFVNYCQLSVFPQYLPSILRQLSVCPLHLPLTFCAFAGPSVNFHELPSIFRASMGTSVNFCVVSVHPQNFPSTTVNFPYFRMTFRQLSQNLWACAGPSVNFPCVCWSICQLLQVSVCS